MFCVIVVGRHPALEESNVHLSFLHNDVKTSYFVVERALLNTLCTTFDATNARSLSSATVSKSYILKMALTVAKRKQYFSRHRTRHLFTQWPRNDVNN